MVKTNFHKIVVGLGNPGAEYKNTRHNIGFIVLDKLCKKLHTRSLNTNKNSTLAKKKEWLFLFPLTYMNLSGVVLHKIVRKYNIETKNILVIVDDVNLEIGKIRIRSKGSAGGHNGLKSIIKELGSDDFKRLRIGINSEINNESQFPENLEDYVLSEFSAEDTKILEKPIEQSVELLTHFLYQNYKKMVDSFSKLNTLSS
ncbi:MAG: aminoacyl-tRNA hydrolase [Candidatus Cloacimonadota bacterium]|nr:aminoacyl-tRNA hydrolase [Candidatus Cloacimonadota bacterium]